jgi:hypothetical protein
MVKGCDRFPDLKKWFGHQPEKWELQATSTEYYYTRTAAIIAMSGKIMYKIFFYLNSQVFKTI